MIETIRKLNTAIELHPIWSDSFNRYGRTVMSETLEKAATILREKAEMPETGTFYTPRADDLFDGTMHADISARFFGGLPAEIGYCIGRNTCMNALEYHKCSEVLAFNGDVLIYLGRMEDIDILSGIYQMSRLEAFYVPSGSLLELYPGTLHYGALQTSDAGFSFIVCLLDGTNTPLQARPEGRENEMLIQKNKWVICNDEAVEEIAEGAARWIAGGSISIVYPSEAN